MDTALASATDCPPETVREWIEGNGGQILSERDHYGHGTQYMVQCSEGRRWLLTPVAPTARQRQADAGRSLPSFTLIEV